MKVKYADIGWTGIIRLVCEGGNQGIRGCLGCAPNRKAACYCNVGNHKNIGTDEKPTLVGKDGGSSSVLLGLEEQCGCHFWVEGGEVVNPQHPERNLRLEFFDKPEL